MYPRYNSFGSSESGNWSAARSATISDGGSVLCESSSDGTAIVIFDREFALLFLLLFFFRVGAGAFIALFFGKKHKSRVCVAIPPTFSTTLSALVRKLYLASKQKMILYVCGDTYTHTHTHAHVVKGIPGRADSRFSERIDSHVPKCVPGTCAWQYSARDPDPSQFAIGHGRAIPQCFKYYGIFSGCARQDMGEINADRLTSTFTT